MKFRLLHFVLFVIVIAAAWAIKQIFFGGATELIFLGGAQGSDYCESDFDCVPAQCCHPTRAVNRDNAPDCSDTFCTLQCEQGTLDCGQGEIKCINNRCRAIING